jgi:hypothetical protein
MSTLRRNDRRYRTCSRRDEIATTLLRLWGPEEVEVSNAHRLNDYRSSRVRRRQRWRLRQPPSEGSKAERAGEATTVRSCCNHSSIEVAGMMKRDDCSEGVTAVTREDSTL